MLVKWLSVGPRTIQNTGLPIPSDSQELSHVAYLVCFLNLLLLNTLHKTFKNQKWLHCLLSDASFNTQARHTLPCKVESCKDKRKDSLQQPLPPPPTIWMEIPFIKNVQEQAMVVVQTKQRRNYLQNAVHRRPVFELLLRNRRTSTHSSSLISCKRGQLCFFEGSKLSAKKRVWLRPAPPHIQFPRTPPLQHVVFWMKWLTLSCCMNFSISVMQSQDSCNKWS